MEETEETSERKQVQPEISAQKTLTGVGGGKHGGDSPQSQLSAATRRKETEREERFGQRELGEQTELGGQRLLGQKEPASTDKEQEVRVAGVE